MEKLTYYSEGAIEEHHWWFVGRRKLFSYYLKTYCPNKDSKIADIGVSSGTNLRLLKDSGYSDFKGLDISAHAIELCRKKGFDCVVNGDATNIPFGDGSFDFIFATDILEHIPDDIKAVNELNRILKSNAFAIITVPAFTHLWGLQDEVSHHVRRYNKSQLVDLLNSAGFEIHDLFYFNFLLYPLIYISRALIKFFDLNIDSENNINNSIINRILMAIFLIDIFVAKRIAPPFGVSCFALVKKTCTIKYDYN